MELQNIIYEKKEHVAIITLNRPKALNALNEDLLNELELALLEAEKDTDVRVMIITGEGKAFAAGADIAAMKDMSAKDGYTYIRKGQLVYRHIEAIAKPAIAAVNGFALGGGCELALACDIRIASTKAKMGLPETGLGIIPGFGGTQRLPRLIGDGKAKEMIFTNKVVSGEEAYALGLVNQVVEPEALMETAEQLANTIAGKAPLAIAYAKDVINRGRQADLDTALSIEARVESCLFATEDKLEGMTAFVEKRTPEYKGN